jgi:hypothetical protein
MYRSLYLTQYRTEETKKAPFRPASSWALKAQLARRLTSVVAGTESGDDTRSR